MLQAKKQVMKMQNKKKKNESKEFSCGIVMGNQQIKGLRTSSKVKTGNYAPLFPLFSLFPLWSKLPKDLKRMVLQHLGYFDLIRSRGVSREWKELVDYRLGAMPSFDIYKLQFGSLESPLTLSIAETMGARFKNKFIRERVLLFNRLFKTTINPEAYPFRIIENICVQNTKQMNCSFVVTFDKVHIGMKGTSHYSEAEYIDLDTKEHKWNLIDPRWKTEDPNEVIGSWDRHFNYFQHHADQIQEWFQNKRGEQVNIRQFIHEDPEDWFMDGSTYGDTFYFFLHSPSLIFGYILYQTQKFLNQQNIDWRTFSYMPYDIDKRLKWSIYNNNQGPKPKTLSPYLVKTFPVTE